MKDLLLIVFRRSQAFLVTILDDTGMLIVVGCRPRAAINESEYSLTGQVVGDLRELMALS